MTNKNIIGNKNDSVNSSWQFNPNGLDDVVKNSESSPASSVDNVDFKVYTKKSKMKNYDLDQLANYGLAYDSKGKLHLDLKRIAKMVVNISDLEEYTQLMKFYRLAGWEYAAGNSDVTTSRNIWCARNSEVYCTIEDEFYFGNKEIYSQVPGFEFISLKEFCEKQQILPLTTKIVNDYYDKKHKIKQ